MRFDRLSVFQLVAGLMWIGHGLDLMLAQHRPFIGTPIAIWGGLWLAMGVASAVMSFFHDTRSIPAGFLALVIPPGIWFGGHFAYLITGHSLHEMFQTFVWAAVCVVIWNETRDPTTPAKVR